LPHPPQKARDAAAAILLRAIITISSTSLPT
jgi:hypothetical protein